MNAEKFAEEALKSDARIRFVGVVDNEFHVLISTMREGVQSIGSEDEERSFIQIMPPIIVDAVEKLQPLLGRLDNVTLRYEKLLVVFFRLEGLIVILTFNADVSTPFISSLSESMRGISSRFLRP